MEFVVAIVLGLLTSAGSLIALIFVSKEEKQIETERKETK